MAEKDYAPSLVGREGRCASCVRPLRSYGWGEGGVVWFTGRRRRGQPAARRGIGGIERADPAADLLWLEGRCLEMIQAAAYGPFVGLLQAHLTAAAEPAGAAQGAFNSRAWVDDLTTQGWLTPEQRLEMGPLLARLLAAHDGDAVGTSPSRGRPATTPGPQLSSRA